MPRPKRKESKFRSVKDGPRYMMLPSLICGHKSNFQCNICLICGTYRGMTDYMKSGSLSFTKIV